jgi:hypothetical protein
MKRIRMIRRPPVPEHPLQRQIADALRLEIAPPGRVSGHWRGVVERGSRGLSGHCACRSDRTGHFAGVPP